MTIALHKPYGTLSRFTDDNGRPTLAALVELPGVYPVGRLDLDSEGLLLLSDEPRVTTALTRPGRHWKTYWAQVEHVPGESALTRLQQGVQLKDGLTRPARARLVPEPNVPDRDPPIRYRKSIPTAWLELELQEGRNRQVRRMTAAVGFPTLRLIRVAVGPIRLGDLAPGRWRKLTETERAWVSKL